VTSTHSTMTGSRLSVPAAFKTRQQILHGGTVTVGTEFRELLTLLLTDSRVEAQDPASCHRC
jgi:hypothetical protein